MRPLEQAARAQALAKVPLWRPVDGRGDQRFLTRG